MRIIGLDPGLQRTGWGVIEAVGNRLRHVAHGTVKTDVEMPMADRLVVLHRALCDVLKEHAPDEAAVEEVFVNANPRSTLKLGQARGVVLLSAGTFLRVAEYQSSMVKKAVVGTGSADKKQVHAMVTLLLNNAVVTGADAADALAVAITHAHLRASARMLDAAE